MLSELWTWATTPSNSAGIQALSAVAAVLVTLGLVVFAGVQSWLMGSQRKVMVQAREAEVQPYVHVTQARSLFKLVFGTTLINVGKGPALSVRSELRHPQLHIFRYGYIQTKQYPNTHDEQVEYYGPLLLPAGGAEKEVAFQATQGFQSQAKAPGTLKVEYYDLLGRWWQTEVPIQFSLTGSPDVHTEVAVLDQCEKVKQISKPTIE